MATSHRKVSRTYAGEADGQALTDWLNRNHETAEGRAVIHLMNGIRRLIPDLPFSEWIRQEQSGMSVKEYINELNKLNRQLSRYKIWPMLLRRSTQVGKWGKGGRGLEALSRFSWKWSDGRNPATEAVHLIVRLAEQGLFNRVRQCAVCNSWYYARFRHQTFCSTECRQKHLKSGPEWKAYRREYMRRYRRR